MADFTFAHREEGFDEHIEKSIRGYEHLLEGFKLTLQNVKEKLITLTSSTKPYFLTMKILEIHIFTMHLWLRLFLLYSLCLKEIENR